MEKREAILRLHSMGKSCKEIANALKIMKVTKSTAWYTIKRFKETKSLENRPKSGRPRSVRTKKLIQATRLKIFRNGRRSLRKMATDAGIKRESMRKIVREDLKMRPFHLQKRHLLSGATMEKRLARSKLLLKWMNSCTRTSIIWTDEKIFTVEQAFNSHNDRILGRKRKDIPVNEQSIFRRQKPASVMVWAGVTSCGKKTPLIFIPEGVKVNQDVYLDMLRQKVLPWINSQQWEHSYLFQQDGAPSHTAKKVQAWCEQAFQGFWPRQMWPPSSPDLNVMDFSIWSILEGKVGTKTYSNINTLKAAIEAAWSELDAEVIRTSCSSVQRRLKQVIAAKGGHFM